MSKKDLPIIAAISGGRDSTAMTLKSLENGDRIDHIVFTNTLEEFPFMYEYIKRLNKYIMENYGKSIIITKPLSTFEDWVFGEIKRGDRKGMVRGLPMQKDPCYWKRESKIYPQERLMKAFGLTEYITLIGYVKGEENRIQKDESLKYPLIEWGWCEGDVDSYLESINMVNPLYEYFSRTGCRFCPYQSLQSLYIVWKFFRKTWRYMKRIERKLKSMNNVLNDQWRSDYTLIELEKKFKENKDGKFSDIPVKACMCAI